MLDAIAMIMPQSLFRIIRNIDADTLKYVEEIRVRENRPLEIVYKGSYSFVTDNGTLIRTSNWRQRHSHMPYIPNREDCMQLLDLIANHSLYTMEEQLKRGYVTVKGGHRVGLAGSTTVEHGAVKQLRTISSFNIRLAREIHDVGKKLLPEIIDKEAKTVHHTLIISAPQHGKTTMVRDLARIISNGLWPLEQEKWQGLKVGIIDERSEIAACHEGVPTFDVGLRTDVLDSCPKAEGMMMMIRSMSPDVIVVDEIGREEDAEAIYEAIHAGIRVIATAHGHSLTDMFKRPTLRTLVQEKAFSRLVVLDRSFSIGTVKCVYDSDGQVLKRRKAYV